MIFISDPYFNEPAYEGMRGTAEGGSSSLKYNSGERRQRYRTNTCSTTCCTNTRHTREGGHP